MTMTNAEWVIKSGYKYYDLDCSMVGESEYDIFLRNTCIDTIENDDSPLGAMLKWLDMEHEETEDKHNDVKHAHWIDMRLDDVHVCSHCDKVVVFSNGNDLIYCPYCGARMDEEEKCNEG